MAFFKTGIAVIWTMFGWRTRSCTFISDSTLTWRRFAFLTLICFTATSVPPGSPSRLYRRNLCQFHLSIWPHPFAPQAKDHGYLCRKLVDISLLTANNGSLAFMAVTGGTGGFQLVKQTDHYWLWCGLFFATVKLCEVASWWFYNKATAVVALFYLFPITIPNIPCIRPEVAACYDSNY